MTRHMPLLLAAVVMTSTSLYADAQLTLKNWTISPAVDLSPGLVFVAIRPCRAVDTRGINPGAFGGPIVTENSYRNWILRDAPNCSDIPATVNAYSTNVAVFGSTPGTADNFIKAYPTGGVEPNNATINYVGGQTLSNAAIIPTGTPPGSITVYSNRQTHVIIDVNGYWSVNLNMGNQAVVAADVPHDAVVIAQNLNATMGDGIYGLATGQGIGVYGDSPDGVGLWGYGDVGTGVYGDGFPTGTSGVGFGDGGRAQGVWGSTTMAGPGSAGVLGSGANANLQWGVLGETDSNNVPLTPGILSDSPFAVAGHGTSGGVRGVTGDFVSGTHSSRSVLGFVLNANVTGSQAAGILGYDTGTTVYGVYAVGDYGGSGAKMFVEPHPTDARKVIRYVALEGPEAGTYFRGKGRFQGRRAIIEVPEDFRIVTDQEGLTVQVTPIGEPASVAVVALDLNRIELKSTRDVEFYYHVHGIRRAFKDFVPIIESGEYRPEGFDSRLPESLPPELRQRLIQNGTYSDDGTVNQDTAERLGWADQWREDSREKMPMEEEKRKPPRTRRAAVPIE